MATERIQIIVEERGTRVVQRRIEDIGDESSKSARKVNLLADALLALASGVIVRQLLGVADAFIRLQNSVSVANNGLGNANQTLQELLQISRDTRSPLEANVELYQRLSLASSELGASQEDILQAVGNVGRALAIQGVSSQQVSGTLIQLSQALGEGTVRAQEFNSILENGLVIAQAVARGIDEAGGSVSRLRQLVIDGEISSREFFEALLSQTEELEQQFSTTEATLSQALQAIRDEFTVAFGEDAVGPLRVVINLLTSVADNIDTVIRLLGAAGLSGALILVTRGVRTLTAAIAANPIGLLLTALTTGIALLITFSDQILISSDGVATLADLGAEVFERLLGLLRTIGSFIAPLFNALNDATGDFFSNFDFSLRGLVTIVATSIDGWVALFDAAYNTVLRTWRQLPAALADIFISLQNFQIDIIESVFNAILSGLSTVLEFGRPAIETLGNLFVSVFNGIGTVVANATNFILSNLQDVIDGAVNGINEIINGVNAVVTFLGGSALGNLSSPELGRVAFEGLDDITLNEGDLDLGQVSLGRLTNPFEGEAAAIAEVFLQEFDQAILANTGARDAVNEFFDSVEERAQERVRQAELAIVAEEEEARKLEELAAAERELLAIQEERRRLESITDSFADIEDQANLLRLTAEAREVELNLRRVEKQLLKEGTDLRAEENVELRNSFELSLQQLQVTAAVSEALDEVRGVSLNLTLVQEELNNQVAAGIITAEQAAEAFRLLEQSIGDTANTVDAGFSNGLDSVFEEFSDVSGQIEGAVVNAFGNMTDAVVDFAQTGKFNFADFASSVIDDLLRIAAQQAILGLISNVFGVGPGVTLFNGLAGSRNNGGPVEAGRSYLVGETQPEIFRPTESGNIQQIPQGASAGGSGVRIINVVDPAAMADYLASPEGEQIVVNHITRNPQAVQQAAGG